jgi:hypothetical protein
MKLTTIGSSGAGSPGPQVDQSPTPAEDLVAQRFRDMVGDPAPDEDRAGSHQDSGRHSSPASASLGDAILSALSNATDGVSSSWRQVQEGLALPPKGTSLSPGELLLYTEKMRIWGLQTEIISKGISKATQDVDQLLKPQ